MTLEELVNRLENKTEVDAVAVTGSAGSGTLNLSSDYDLLIVLRENPVSVASGATETDGRFTDLGFVTLDEIREIPLGAPLSLEPNDRYTTIIRSLRLARIAFDKSGALTKLQASYAAEPTYDKMINGERISRLDRASYNLAHTKRKVTSTDPDYGMAVDMRMLYQLDHLMVDYFLVRGLPWPGEKEALRYWRAEDPGYYTLFRSCLYETDRKKRVRDYERLAVETMKPVGSLWHRGETRFRLSRETDMTAENLDKADRFWASLIE